ncbi:MAG TPA: hypothetical protein VFE24_10125 [Pirellulales bacterium]|jgi:hypothetical protein|nr:hypothetical protein [Pirellulales bacterium]
MTRLRMIAALIILATLTILWLNARKLSPQCNSQRRHGDSPTTTFGDDSRQWLHASNAQELAILLGDPRQQDRPIGIVLESKQIDDSAFRQLIGTRNVTALRLVNTAVTDLSAPVLCDLPLDALDLVATGLTCRGLECFRTTSIQWLGIDESLFDNDSIVMILKMPRLRIIDIHSGRISCHDSRILDMCMNANVSVLGY